MGPIVRLKRCLLVFWAVWFSIVFFSNLADALLALHWLPESWTFASGNFKLIRETTARYSTLDWLSGVLFAGVIAWEGLAAVLFWRAGWFFRGKDSTRPVVYPAITTALLLWASFLIADEIFIAYRFAGTHLALFVAHLVTLLAIELLPEKENHGKHGWHG